MGQSPRTHQKSEINKKKKATKRVLILLDWTKTDCREPASQPASYTVLILTEMASMAAIGVKRPPSSSSLSSSSSSNLSRRTAFRSLSFSSSSNLSGGKVCSTAFSVRRDTGRNERTPMIVSPKAVSDSRNSQTCLDPDASRVSFLLHLLVLLLILLLLLL